MLVYRLFFTLLVTFALSACGSFLPSEGVDDGDAGDDTDANRVDLPAHVDGDGSADGAPALPSYVFKASSAAPFFVDDFERPDGVVGNDWSDGAGGAMTLSSGDVILASGSGSMAVAALTRPASQVDLEACADVFLATGDEVAIFLRGSDSQSYRALLNPSQIIVGRVTITAGSKSFAEVSFGFLERLAVEKDYRFCVRVSGADLVSIEAGVYAPTNLDSPLHSTRMTDEDVARVKTPGFVGLMTKLTGASRWRSITLR